jgi:hypothetical protein
MTNVLIGVLIGVLLTLGAQAAWKGRATLLALFGPKTPPSP